MRELSLFSGAGGGVLGTRLLGWETVGYVEQNPYCQTILSARIKDGTLHEGPVFSDINAFISEGYADAYKGMVDVITAGFPCQPFSVAGSGKASSDPRNCWPQTIEVIRKVKPRFCLLENVPGLLSRKHRYFETILKDLAKSGYDARWKVISASEVGAPHKRARLWIVAFNSNNLSMGREERTGEGIQSIFKESERQESQHLRESIPESGNVAYPKSIGMEGSGTNGKQESQLQAEQGLPRRNGTRGGTVYWETEPNVCRVANGVANWVDRLKAIGNGQVPEVVATAWEVLTSTWD